MVLQSDAIEKKHFWFHKEPYEAIPEIVLQITYKRCLKEPSKLVL